MNVELSVRDVNLVFFEGSHNNTEAVAANLEAVHGVTGDDDLIIE